MSSPCFGRFLTGSELGASPEVGGAFNSAFKFSVVEYGDCIGLRSLEIVFKLNGWTIPGEQDDTDVGVVSLLLQGPVEPEY